MVDAADTNVRKESELTLGGKTILVRPTLDKLQRIENRFGPAMGLMNRVASGNITQADLLHIVTIMLRGASAGISATALPDLIFRQGVISLSNEITTFLANGISSDAAPSPEDEEPEGNA